MDSQSLRTEINLKDTDWGAAYRRSRNYWTVLSDYRRYTGISISEMRSKCRKYKLEHGLELIIIDYLQLMSGSVGGRSESRQQEISYLPFLKGACP